MAKTNAGTATGRKVSESSKESGARLLAKTGDDPQALIDLIRFMDMLIAARPASRSKTIPRRRTKKST